jgi:hypothetical protein
LSAVIPRLNPAALCAIVFVCATDLALLGRHQRPSSHETPTPAIANPHAVRFDDVTRASGIRFRHERAASPEKLYPETLGAGAAWIDFDSDGWLDAFFVNSGYTPLFRPAIPPQPALFRNNGDRTFTDVTAASGLRTDGTFYMGVAVEPVPQSRQWHVRRRHRPRGRG